MIRQYAAAVSCPDFVCVRVVHAASEMHAVIAVLKDMEGFEEWDWESFHSMKQLKRELSECEFHCDTTEV